MSKRVFFKDLSQETLLELEKIYYPIFEGISDMTLQEAYDSIGVETNLKETAIRSGMKNRYELSKYEDFDSQLTAREFRLEKQIHDFRRQRLVFNQHKRDVLDESYLMDSLESALDEIDIKAQPIKREWASSKQPYRVMISDLHIGKYEYDIHSDLLLETCNRIVENVPTEYPLELWFGGDTIDGLLRVSQIRKIKMNLVDQVANATELITSFIETLSQEYCISDIKFINESNHDQIRPLGSNRSDFPEENLSKFIGEALYRYCQVKMIPFEHNKEFVVDIAGKDVVFLHGDEFRNPQAMYKYYEGMTVLHGHFHNFYHNQFGIGLPPMVWGDDYTKGLGIAEVETKPAFLIENNGFVKEVVVYE